jgi:acyl-CoA synthetase (AMP-forming)/AMP-acid ligase II
VHIPSSMILAEPMVFLNRITVHKVTYTFAPNFFLASLVQRLLEAPSRGKENEMLQGTDARVQIPKQAAVDLSSLRAFISGGESNVVQTCSTLTDLLQHFGAPASFIRPGFGMTETCAGSIYNAVDCPAYDLGRNAEYACLGDCIPGIQFRFCRQNGSVAPADEIGELQVTGEVVFKAYYNDTCSTTKSFTTDGWFRTGDRGYKDTNGRLHLTGRDKDTVIING